jgi:hypothetical protein
MRGRTRIARINTNEGIVVVERYEIAMTGGLSLPVVRMTKGIKK